MTEPREMNMVWECPQCGAQLAQFEGVVFHPPSCTFGHGSVEMEQRAASRWMRQFEEVGDQ